MAHNAQGLAICSFLLKRKGEQGLTAPPAGPQALRRGQPQGFVVEVFLSKQSSRDTAEREGWVCGSSPRSREGGKELEWGVALRAGWLFYIDGAWSSGLDGYFT